MLKRSTPPCWRLFGTLCVAVCLCCTIPRAFADGTDPAPPNPAPQPTASAADLRKQAEALKYTDPKASAALYAQLVAGDTTPADKADDLDNQADELLNVADWKTAEQLARQALDLHKQVSDLSGEGKSERIVARALCGQGKNQDAIGLCENVLALDKNAHAADEEANALRTEGIAYDDLSQHAKAIDYYNQALSIFRTIGDRKSEAGVLTNIGNVYDNLSQFSTAIYQYDQALSIFRRIGNRDGEALALTNLGAAYGQLSKYAQALDDYHQALPVNRSIGDRLGEAQVLAGIGRARLGLRQYSTCIDRFVESLSIYRDVGDRNSVAEDLHDLLLVLRDRSGSPRRAPLAAVAFGKQAVNLFQQMRTEFTSLDQDSQKSFVKSKEPTYRDLADILIAKGRLAEAEQVLGMLKEQEYFDFIGHDRAAAPSLKATVAFTPEEQKWITQYDALGDTVEHVQASVDALAKEKKQDTPVYKQTRTKLASANAAFSTFINELPKRFNDVGKGTDVAQKLQDAVAIEDLLTAAQGEPWTLKACAIYTVEADSQYDVVLVTPNAQRAGAYPIKADALNAKVEAFRQAVLDKTHDPRPLAKELYDILLGPVAKDIDAYRPDLVMWSLDGPLSLVPVSALYDGKQYLVQRWQSELFNAASIPAISDSSASHSFAGALGMGVSKGRVVGEDTFGDLAEVPDELGGIFSDPAHQATGPVPGAYLLDGDFKTEDAMTRLQEGGHRLVHLATHFKLDPAGSASSYLLTGDGVITLADLSANGRIFRGVDLLTLSACSTAVGDRNALDATAQLLGAHAILATLWDVSDASTGVFMKSFYGDMTAASHDANGKPMTTAEAVREAQLSLLGSSQAAPTAIVMPVVTSPSAHRGIESVPQSDERTLPASVPDPLHPYAHPYYWAPFVLLGNWR